jgi:squalene synthase HpnC
MRRTKAKGDHEVNVSRPALPLLPAFQLQPGILLDFAPPAMIFDVPKLRLPLQAPLHLIWRRNPALPRFIMPVDHYENFPVASVLLPARLRPAVEAIYAFARSADDLADEGDAPPEQRLGALAAYEEELDRIATGSHVQTPLFRRLALVIVNYDLPLQPFRDLLSAFAQDVVTKRYETIEQLLDYCRRSANPVGILMLHLYGVADAEKLRMSDAICSALQLINFWQDITIDWRKERVYLPQADLRQFHVSERHIEGEIADANWQTLMAFEVARARSLMLQGAPLALMLPGRVGWELRLVVQGGLRILERIEGAGYDVFRHRPTLTKRDYLRMLWRALRMR